MKDYLRDAFGITHGDRTFRVKLRFSAGVATYIAERQWHPTQKVIRKKDGSLELSMETRGWKELVRWILSWQPDVTVIEPKELRDRIRQKMKEGLATV